MANYTYAGTFPASPVLNDTLLMNGVTYTYTSNASWEVTAGVEDSPLNDTTSIVKGSTDGTKQARFEVDGLTTGTTRVLTVQDADGTIALTSDIGSGTNLTTKGDLEAYTTTQTRLAVGTNDQVLTSDSTAAAGIAWKDAAGGGKVLQVLNVQDGALASGTTTTPFDDTIPQITEGDENMTLSITPLSATSKLAIDVTTLYGNDTLGMDTTVALFVGTTAGALASGHNYNDGVTGAFAAFKHTMTSGVTSALTFRVRIGAASASTTTFNGYAGLRKLGGSYASSITITEYEV